MSEFFNSTTGIIVIVLLILLTREIWTWFFKLNRLTKQNKEIIRLLSKLANEPEPMSDMKKTGQAIGLLFKRKQK